MLDGNKIGDGGIVVLLYVFRSFYCKLGYFNLGGNLISCYSCEIFNEVLKSFFCYLEWLILRDFVLSELFEVKNSIIGIKLI